MLTSASNGGEGVGLGKAAVRCIVARTVAGVERDVHPHDELVGMFPS